MAQVLFYITSGKKALPYSIILIRPQSGHIQVGPFVMPHLFSSRQGIQI